MDSYRVLQKLFDRKSLLDLLIQVEKFLDSMNLYAYANWFKGEIVEGPQLSRYWISLGIKYPRSQMPDPDGAKVLSKVGVKVKYHKTVEKVPVTIKEPEDYREGSRKPKLESVPVWIVRIKVPRKFIDEVDLEDLQIYDDEVDIEDITDAKDKGLNEQ